MKRRIAVYTIQEVFDLIKVNNVVWKGNPRVGRLLNMNVTLHDFKVKLNSDRYEVFIKKGIKCSECGLEGSFFALETSKADEKVQRAHFNLYAIKEDKEILMTKDHIVAYNLGGQDFIDNYRTLCSQCNGIKGSIEQKIIERKGVQNENYK